MTPEQFIEAFANDAIISCSGYPGLFPSVLLSQAALETGWATSSVSLHNNFFGIKAIGDYSGSSYEGYRTYSAVIDSFYDRNDLLTELSIYNAVPGAATPASQCFAIKAGGWAEDPEYAEKLIDIINTHHLTEFDTIQPQYASVSPLLIIAALGLLIRKTI